MSERTEKDLLEKIETGIQLERRDIEAIKRYIIAAFWITAVAATVVIISKFL